MSKPWYSLEGKTIWITGGAGYLGSAVTRELDACAGKVLCIDLPGKAEALIKEHGLKHTVPLSYDVSLPEKMQETVDAIVAEHGVPDGVAHLALYQKPNPAMEELKQEEFQLPFIRSLTPTFVLCRALGEKMKARGSGSIVVYASMYGVVAPDPRIYHPPMTVNPIDYGAYKAAVLQLVRYMAVHYGPSGVRYNCVTPGPFPNPKVQAEYPGFIKDLSGKTALRRIGVNTEIVGPTMFLLSDSASFVTGHSLVVDGGWTIW